MAVAGAASQLVALADVRPRAADVLAPIAPDDPAVHVNVVDSLDPPALMLAWDEPWLQAGSPQGAVMGPCGWTARLAVLCVGSRVEPGPGVLKLEELVAYTIARLKADGYPWPFAGCTAPRVFEIAGVRYLAARLTYAVPVSI